MSGEPSVVIITIGVLKSLAIKATYTTGKANISVSKKSFTSVSTLFRIVCFSHKIKYAVAGTFETSFTDAERQPIGFYTSNFFFRTPVTASSRSYFPPYWSVAIGKAAYWSILMISDHYTTTALDLQES